MKTEKMSFTKIKDVLSRDEMKQIMAGSGGAGFVCAYCYTQYNGRMNCDSARGRCYCPIASAIANYC